MNLPELASAIIDTHETFDPDEMISISALPDNVLIRSYYCDPHSGVSILSDYTDLQLDGLFSTCKSLSDATDKVAKLYASKPLDRVEANLARDTVLRAVLDCTYQIAAARRADGHAASLETIVTLVVKDLRQYFGNFQH